jgi:hypothetical protein
MIQREIARRTDSERVFLPFRFIVHDEPAAKTDVAAAVKAIEEEVQARGEGDERVVIASSIKDAVVAALRAAHPRRFNRPGQHIAVLSRIIVKPGDPDIPSAPWRDRSPPWHAQR